VRDDSVEFFILKKNARKKTRREEKRREEEKRPQETTEKGRKEGRKEGKETMELSSTVPREGGGGDVSILPRRGRYADDDDMEEVQVVEEDEDEDGEGGGGGDTETDVLTKEWDSKTEKAKLRVRLHHLLYLLMFFGFVGFVGSCVYLRWAAKTHRLEQSYNCTVTSAQPTKCSEGPGINCADLTVSLFLCNETLNGTIRVEIPPEQINATYPVGSLIGCYATGGDQSDESQSTKKSECNIVPQSSKTDVVTACFFLIATLASTASCGYCIFWRSFRGARVLVKRTHYDEL